jgi:hypothetical protein
MKNLANCTPKEFLKQTYKIKKLAEKWVKEIDVMNIRKKMPVLESVDGLEGEELETVRKRNQKAVQNKAMDNIMEILDKIMDENCDDTVALLALVCFVEPEDADKHSMSEYLGAIGELISDPGVLSFFTSLAQLEQKNI